jgi:phosphonate transport system permease protein
VPAVILAYLIYIFFAFDMPGLAERARMDNAAILVADSYSYKTHVTRDNRSAGRCNRHRGRGARAPIPKA